MNTYTPWATNVRLLEGSCPVHVFEQLKCRGCAAYIPNPASFRDFLTLVNNLVSMTYDDNAWYVKIGGVNTNFTGVNPNKKPDIKSKTAVRPPDASNGGAGTGTIGVGAGFGGGWNNGVGQLDVLIVRNSSYSIRVFDRDGPRTVESLNRLSMVRTYLRFLIQYFYFFSFLCSFLYLYQFHFVLQYNTIPQYTFFLFSFLFSLSLSFSHLFFPNFNFNYLFCILFSMFR
jgi:hypothetical protein